MVLDEDEEQRLRSYRKKDIQDEKSDDEDDRRSEYDRSRSFSRSPERRPYSRDSDSENDHRPKKGGKTRLKKKIVVGSDAEDEIEREEDQLNLLEKMKNLRKKFSEME